MHAINVYTFVSLAHIDRSDCCRLLASCVEVLDGCFVLSGHTEEKVSHIHLLLDTHYPLYGCW